MLTALVSDLHLGSAADVDLARRPEIAERLAQALSQADRVVVLGDLLELRERPAAEVLELAAPTLAALGTATAGKELVLVPGNHDHELVAPARARARLAGAGTLGLEATFDPLPGELAGIVAGQMPETRMTVAYPGVWLRPDLYATHGHYLDMHLTIPRIECVFAAAIGRYAVPAGISGPERYEAALAPLYAFAHHLTQSSREARINQGGSLSRAVWSSLNPSGGRRSPAAVVAGRVALPAAIGAINALGIGPFRTDISAIELRRAGLRAMADVVAELAIDAEHVIFGHTHRAGPLPGETEGWWLRCGTQLTNTGSWIQEDVFIGEGGEGNPYWPGRVTLVRDEGAPEQVTLLGPEDLRGRG